MATETFNIYRRTISKETGEIVKDFDLILESVVLTDNVGVFDCVDNAPISNDIYGYVAIPTTEDIGIVMNPDIYVHYLLDFLVVTLGIDEIDLDPGLIRLHGEISQMIRMPVTNFSELDLSTNTAYASLINISDLASVDCYFEYRKSDVSEWTATLSQELIVEADFNDTVVFSTTGKYFIRSVVEFVVSSKTYKLYSNVIDYYIEVV